MPRESARQKSDRLLLEGRVIVTRADRDYIEARVRGEGALYTVGYLAGRWWCECKSIGEGCSHIWALKRISAPDLQPSLTIGQDVRIKTGDFSNGFESSRRHSR